MTVEFQFEEGTIGWAANMDGKRWGNSVKFTPPLSPEVANAIANDMVEALGDKAML